MGSTKFLRDKSRRWVGAGDVEIVLARGKILQMLSAPLSKQRNKILKRLD